VTEVSSSVIPTEFVSGTRTYLERLVKQVNGSYDSGYYDASLVLLRRLMESLIIEVYIKEKRVSEIRDGSVICSLNKLIGIILNDDQIHKSRAFKDGLILIKDLGDTAAHDRNYITPRMDVDENKRKLRRVIYELLVLSGIKN
jgi:hypothetical protein